MSMIFFLNDSDGSSLGPGTYLSDAQDYLGIPTVVFASSNLPDWYLDTRFGDQSYLKAFTIGCAKAAKILPNTWYYYYIRTNNGDAQDDNGFLQGQIGYRNPESCYTTWCAFSAQLPVNIYSPYDLAPIPGSFTWDFRYIFLPLIRNEPNSGQNIAILSPYPSPGEDGNLSQDLSAGASYPGPYPVP